MRILLLAASALALTIGTSSLAQGNGNRGGGGKPERAQQGGGHGGGHGQQAGRGRGGGDRGGPQMVQRGGGNERAGRGNSGGKERAARGNGQQRQAERAAQRGGPDRDMRGNGNGNGNGNGRAMAQRGQQDRDRGQGRGGGNRDRMENRGGERFAAPGQTRERGPRLTQRRAMQVEDAANVARLQWEPAQNLGRGCPPGLAAKNNGCLPPGQARQIAQAQNWYNGWWSYPDSTDYFYNDGYLLRLDGSEAASGYVPLLGGALWTGNTWPEQYEASPVPDYHQDYYGLQDGYDYRLADGAIYGVDPNSDLIQQVVALIAGDDWSIGQAMPSGYDVYNVPYEFRDQYQDTPDAMYRYSDGYVYQVDPTTQLIQAAIQLVT